jgi:anti-sigma regulatory factor (Ser/Thr protein kinase)
MSEIFIEAKTENLDAVLDFVAGELEATDCPIKTQTQIAIAVEEVFVNIAYYAYNPEVGHTLIRVSVGEQVVIEFEDSGKPYNPLDKEDPDITLNAEERQLGGLGVFMVKNIMDSVDYQRKGNKNILTIKKK